jgi:hypothetical protein
MDSRNSGTAPAGHIQTFDCFSKNGRFLRVLAEGNQSERANIRTASAHTKTTLEHPEHRPFSKVFHPAALKNRSFLRGAA